MIQIYMVVFYFIIINIIMIFINIFFMMFSMISIEINNFQIVGLDKIIDLLLNIKLKSYIKLLNYINFKIIIRMRLFGKITLIKITLKSELIKKIIKKVISKNDSKLNSKKNIENKSIYKAKKELKNISKNKSEDKLKNALKKKAKINLTDKKKSKNAFKNFCIKLISKLILKFFKIAEIKLDCSIGLSRADITSMMAGFLNFLISSLVAYYFTKDNKKKIEIESSDIKYYINPIYSEKVEIKLCFIAGISSKMY